MSGTFIITENLTTDGKFQGKVSFNDKDPEYYEVDLDTLDRTIVDLQTIATQAASDLKANQDLIELYTQKLNDLNDQTVTLETGVATANGNVSDAQALKDNPASFINAQLQIAADADADKAEEVPLDITVGDDGKLVE